MGSNDLLYIFVNQCMSGVGGGQRYVLAKAKWLLERDWHVVVCHVENGEIVLEHDGIQFIDIPELRAAPRLLGKKKVCSIVQEVLSSCPDAGSTYVESAAPYLGLWGEEIARAARGRHLCYVLEEFPKVEALDFLRFKRGRHELAFIKNSIAMRALGDLRDVPQEYDDCVLPAYNPSPIGDLPFEGEIQKADYVIGCVSRLEKPAVKLMLDGLVSFCAKNATTSLTVVLVGDTPYDSVRKDIAAYGERLKNLNVQILGYLSPIPRDLIQKFDLFIGKAGAASACAGEGVPTIRYTLDTDEVAGFDQIIEVNGALTLQRADACNESLPMLLESALLKGGLAKIRELNGNKRITYDCDYLDHMSFIPDSNAFIYYDCWSSKVGIGRSLVSCWIRLFGNTKYEAFLIALRGRFGKQS